MRSMVITLCGSAMFENLYHKLNKALTLAGHTVFTLAVFPSMEEGIVCYTEEEQEILDLSHMRKIARSDAVVVINKGQHIGERTVRELDVALRRGAALYYLEHPEGASVGIGRVEDLL